MVENEKENFLAALNAVMALYSKEVSPSVFHIWWAALEDYEFSDVTRAFTMFVKSADDGSFAPKPADIIRMIEGNSETKAELAWSKVANAIKAAGAYRSVCFDDPIINIVLTDMGGWPKICQGKVDEVQFVAAEFNRKYRAYSSRGVPSIYPSSLPGISESQNRLAGYKTTGPMLIGNPELAQKVLENGSDKPTVQITGSTVSELISGLLTDRST